jgi:hypothetical protein
MQFETHVYEVKCGDRKLGEEVHLIVDGCQFAKLASDGPKYREIAVEICKTMNKKNRLRHSRTT